MRWQPNSSQIIPWNPKHSSHFPTIHDKTGHCIHDNSANYASRFSVVACSILLELHINWQRRRIFWRLRHYWLMNNSSLSVTDQDIYFSIYVISLPLQFNALIKSQHYQNTSISLSPTVSPFLLRHIVLDNSNILLWNTTTIPRLVHYTSSYYIDTYQSFVDGHKFL